VRRAREDIGDRFGRNAGCAEAVRQLAKLRPKQFAGTRIDEDRAAAEQDDVGFNRRLHGRFDVRPGHDFRRGLQLVFGEHAENIERRSAVVDRDNVDLSDFEPMKPACGFSCLGGSLPRWDVLIRTE
jgi:hypothetical protein